MAALEFGSIDPSEISTERLVLDRDGATVPAFHARPDGMPVAGLVLHPDIGGLRPLFDDLCVRLASHGLAVIAVEPFARTDRAQLDSIEARFAAVPKLRDADQIGDLEAAADHLVVHDDVARVSVLGFCMGGYMALKAAASGRFDRAVAFYGMLRTPDAWRAPDLADPLDLAADVCPTLAVFGTVDQFVPNDDVAALRERWADRPDCEIVVVDGAEHGFVHDPERPAHRADDAARCWARALEWVGAA
jgi:carboxymethylenebutenolidase